jgi:glutathione S-transferase
MNEVHTPAPALRLYGADISFFSAKVRAYLRWKGLPFEEVSANRDVYRHTIIPHIGFPVIPVVHTPEGTWLQDSTDIIEALEAQHPEPSVQPPGAVQQLVVRMLELLGDEWLLLPAMHYRWHHNRDWAIQAFGALAMPEGSEADQRMAGERSAGPFAQAAELLGAEPAMHAAVEQAYLGLLQELNAHFELHRFALGDRASVADFALYGPLYAHLYRDPASGAIMKQHAPWVVRWIERLSTAPNHPLSTFPANDQIPETLLPILARQMREQLPDLMETANRFQAWLTRNPGAPVPRVIGKHAFELEGQTGQRITRPYALWMLQRARESYLATSGNDRARADQLLEQVGGTAFGQFEDPPALRRDGMSVALVVS